MEKHVSADWRWGLSVLGKTLAPQILNPQYEAESSALPREVWKQSMVRQAECEEIFRIFAMIYSTKLETTGLSMLEIE